MSKAFTDVVKVAITMFFVRRVQRGKGLNFNKNVTYIKYITQYISENITQ